MTKNQQLKQLLSHYGFCTYKNLRKNTLEEYEKQYAKNKGSSIKNSYKDFEYFIVWAKEQGIRSMIFKNGKQLSESCSYRLLSPKNLEKKTIKYINYLIKNYEKSIID